MKQPRPGQFEYEVSFISDLGSLMFIYRGWGTDLQAVLEKARAQYQRHEGNISTHNIVRLVIDVALPPAKAGAGRIGTRTF